MDKKEKKYKFYELFKTGFIISVKNLTEKEWAEKAPILQEITGLCWYGNIELKNLFPHNPYTHYIGIGTENGYFIGKKCFFMIDKNSISKTCIQFESIDDFLALVYKERWEEK